MKRQPSWGRCPDVILGVWPANCRPSWGRCLYAGLGVWSARCQPSWGCVLSAIFGAWSAIFQPSWGRGHFIFGGGALGLVAILRGAWSVACPPFLWAWSLHFWGTCKLSAILGGVALMPFLGCGQRVVGHLGGRGPGAPAAILVGVARLRRPPRGRPCAGSRCHRSAPASGNPPSSSGAAEQPIGSPGAARPRPRRRQ